jgi:quercetin dioxygenase-like cupin family protein
VVSVIVGSVRTAGRKIARTAPNDANGSQAIHLLFAKEYSMVFQGWLRPDRVLVAVAVVAAGVLACRDTTTPKEVSNAGVPEPSFTAAVGFVGTLVGRGHLGRFDVHSKAAGYDVKLKSHDDTDIEVRTIGVAPGGHSGWHFHPGPVLVIVKVGTITFYHGDDPTCTGTRYAAGSAFIEKGGDVGIARNETASVDTVVATFFVPAGGLTRLDAAAPGNCPF